MKKRSIDDILYDAHFYLYRLEKIRREHPETIMEKHINSARDLHEILSLYHFGNSEMKKISKNALFSWDGTGNSYYPIYGSKKKIIGIIRDIDIYPDMKREFEEYYAGLNGE